MNKRSHLHKKADSSASNPVLSQFPSRPNISQAKPQLQKPLTQTQTENQEFQQQKFEATQLELQAKYGTITPQGQERLTVLQAKMDAFRQNQHKSVPDSSLLDIPNLFDPHEAPQPIQPKLKIGQVGDVYEQEADRVAAKVVSQINAPQTQASAQGEALQREQMPDHNEELQMQPMVQRVADSGGDASQELEAGIQRARGSGQQLASSIREPMEQAFGADFSGVRIHTNNHADQMNQSIQAKAFTTKQDVFFRQGEYNPGSRSGQELIAHELTHVVQQGGSPKNRVQRVEIDSSKIDVATISKTIKSITGKEVELQYEILDPKDLLRTYLHQEGVFPDYNEEKEYENYKSETPEAFCHKETGKIYLNKDSFATEDEIDYGKLNAVLVHEAQHSASFNHKGFQENEDISNNSFVMDEGTADYFAMLTYMTAYKQEADPVRDYLNFTNYYKDMENKREEEWWGWAIYDMLQQDLFTISELKQAYFDGEPTAWEKLRRSCPKIDAIIKNYYK